MSLCRKQRREGVIPQSIAVQRRLAGAGVGTTLQSTGQAGRKAAEPAEAVRGRGLLRAGAGLGWAGLAEVQLQALGS